jgi:hypothetical protein
MKKYLLLASVSLFLGQGAVASLTLNQQDAVAKVSAGKADWATFAATPGYARAAHFGARTSETVAALSEAYSEWSSTQVVHVSASVSAGAPAAKEKAEAMGVAAARNADGVAAILKNTAARRAMVEAIVGNSDARAHIASKEQLLRDLVQEVRIPSPPAAPVVCHSPLKTALVTSQHTALITEIDRQLDAGKPLAADAAVVAGEIVGGAHIKAALATHEHGVLITEMGLKVPGAAAADIAGDAPLTAELAANHHAAMITAIGALPAAAAVVAGEIVGERNLLAALAEHHKAALIDAMAAHDAATTVAAILANNALKAELRASITAGGWTPPAAGAGAGPVDPLV